MIRKSMIALGLGLVTLAAGCTAEPPSPTAPPPLVSTRCDATPVQQYVGQSFSTFTLSDIRIATKSTSARAIAPGTAVSSEFQADRVTVYLDQSNVVTKVVCG